MAEFIAVPLQTVEADRNILFTNATICGNNSIIHSNNSGLITVRGVTRQCRARFKVTFGANIAITEGGVVGPISVAIETNGEPIGSTVMTVTPAAIGDFFNVNRTIYIDIPVGCCTQISVGNISTQSIDVENATLIVERVA